VSVLNGRFEDHLDHDDDDDDDLVAAKAQEHTSK
jgi:hypothetical protein